MLKLATVCMLALGCAGNSQMQSDGASAAAVSNAPIKVLVVTATQGFRHTEGINASKVALTAAEPGSGITFDWTEDLTQLSAANLAKYDVLFMNSSTLRIAPENPADPASVALTKAGRTPIANPINKDQQEAIASFVRNGKGLVAVHAGVDAMYGWEEYRTMVGGGLFLAHPYTREARSTIEDQKNPTVSHYGPSVSYREEYYYLDKNPRPTSHVLSSLDLTSVNDTTKTDHPNIYIRQHGKGRVYVNLLGHFATTWQRQDFVTGVLQGIRVAAGRVPANFKP